MTLSTGSRVGPYEVIAQIGVGGMGEVYRATDTNLKREVAIKVLPADVAGDVDRLARLHREAEVLAALNHPNIAGIHGLEKAGDDALTARDGDAPPDLRTAASSRSTPLAWVMAAVAMFGAAALAVPAIRHLREVRSIAPSETRVDIVTPATGDATSDPLSFALSPDGQQIVFVASESGTSRLWLRSLAAATARPLAGTDGAAFPFWAPNSKSVGFFSGDQLK